MELKTSLQKRNITILGVLLFLLLVVGVILMFSNNDSQPASEQAVPEEVKVDKEGMNPTKAAEDDKADKDSAFVSKDNLVVVNAYINDELHLIKVMSNGTEIDTGYAGVEDESSDVDDIYTVTFVDYNGGILKVETISGGGNATPPGSPSRDGFIFTGWKGTYTNVTSDQTVVAEYTADNPNIERYTVKFVDHDGSVLKTELVEKGKSATAPEVSRVGYSFVRWDRSFTDVTSDLIVTAVYETIVSKDTEITVENMSTTAGSTVDVTVSLTNNPGMVGMTLKLEYDESVMTLTTVTKGDALDEMTFTEPKDLTSDCQFPWDAEEILPEDATNGEILILTFAVSDKATPGNYNVTLSYDYGAIIDNNLKPIDVVLKNGVVTVQ